MWRYHSVRPTGELPSGSGNLADREAPTAVSRNLARAMLVCLRRPRFSVVTDVHVSYLTSSMSVLSVFLYCASVRSELAQAHARARGRGKNNALYMCAQVRLSTSGWIESKAGARGQRCQTNAKMLRHSGGNVTVMRSSSGERQVSHGCYRQVGRATPSETSTGHAPTWEVSSF